VKLRRGFKAIPPGENYSKVGIDKAEVEFMMKHMDSEFDSEPQTRIDVFANITMKELVFGALPPLCPENPDLRFGATEEV